MDVKKLENTLKELDQHLDGLMEKVSGGINRYVQEVDLSLEDIPLEIKVNIIAGVLVVELCGYIAQIRDNNLKTEAVAIKEILNNCIKELDKILE